MKSHTVILRHVEVCPHEHSIYRHQVIGLVPDSLPLFADNKQTVQNAVETIFFYTVYI